MAAKTKEMEQIKQVILRHMQGESNRSIARALGISKNTVNRYVSLAESDKMALKDLVRLEDPVLDFRFNGGSPAYTDERFKDFMARLPHFEREMGRKHMTLQLVWEEYKREKPDGYGITQFRFHYRQNAVAAQAVPTTVLKDLHVGGEMLYLDFAGDPMELVDRETAEVTKVQVFVAVLPASDYAFAMAVPSQRTEDFCYAVDCCLQAIGGVPRQLVPDNLKAAVIKADRYSPRINETFNQLANHYGCVVSPARSLHPRDKALVEDTVRLIYQRVYAPLRNRTFYDIETLNKAIAELVAAHNAKRMQTAEYSRQERFAAVDLPNLQPLPAERFELAYSVQLKVAHNGCVQLGCDRHYYSVPYQHIGRYVTVRFTRTVVKVFLEGECVATHLRSLRKGGYTLKEEHLASHCNAYRERSPQYYIDRATRISATFGRLMELLFTGARNPELHYRSADGMLAMQRTSRPEVFDIACQTAIARGRFDYPYLYSLVKTAQTVPAKEAADYEMPEHDNVRGPSQYA